MLKAIKIRVYPTKSQENYINRLLGSSRFVYNKCLEIKKQAFDDEEVNLNLSDLSRYFHNDLTKNNEYDWLNEHNTKVMKQSIRDLLTAYKSFFKGNGFPNFKKKSNKQACRFPLESISTKNDFSTNKINLNKQLNGLTFRTSKSYTNHLDKHKKGIRCATLSKTPTNK